MDGMNNIGDMMDAAARSAGIAGIMNIIITVVCIWAAWWALQTIRFDIFMKSPKSAQAKLLMIMLSIGIGHTVARFVIDYLLWSTLIKGVF